MNKANSNSTESPEQKAWLNPTRDFEKTNITLSDIKKHENCPAQGYMALRDDKPVATNPHWQFTSLYWITILDYLKSKVKGQDFSRDTRAEIARFGADAFVKVNRAFNRSSPDRFLSLGKIIGINIPVLVRGERANFSTSVDLVALSEHQGNKMISIVKFKFAPGVKKDEDIESVAQAVAASYAYAKEHHGLDVPEFGSLNMDNTLPVRFYRVSAINGVTQMFDYSKEDIVRNQQVIEISAENTKHDLEADHYPEFKPGDHCFDCRFLKQCQMRKGIKTIGDKYKASIFFKQLAKKYETEVKEFAQAELDKNLDTLLESGDMVIPLSGDDYVVHVTRSSSYNLSRKKAAPKKLDLFRSMIEDGSLEGEDTDLVSVDFKITDAVVNHFVGEDPELSQYFNQTHRNTVSLKTPDKKEEFENAVVVKVGEDDK